jgi:putative transposase
MIRVQLTDEERAAVQALRRDRDLAPAERDRVEMVLLSDAGWSPPRVAEHLGYCAATVRTVLKRFRGTGPAGLRRGRPGPPKDEARRQAVTAALDRLLDQDRTWTAAQLADALRGEGIALSTRQTRKYLAAMGARWRRVQRTLRHKQDPAAVARAERVLDSLKKRPPAVASPSASSTSAASAPASR